MGLGLPQDNHIVRHFMNFIGRLFSWIFTLQLQVRATRQTTSPTAQPTSTHPRLSLETLSGESLDRSLVLYKVGWPSKIPLTMLPSCLINYLPESPSNCALSMHIHKTQRPILTLIDIIIFLVCVHFHSETHHRFRSRKLHRAPVTNILLSPMTSLNSLVTRKTDRCSCFKNVVFFYYLIFLLINQ